MSVLASSSVEATCHPDSPARIDEWHKDDPRAAIIVRHLLNMSSGLPRAGTASFPIHFAKKFGNRSQPSIDLPLQRPLALSALGPIITSIRKKPVICRAHTSL